MFTGNQIRELREALGMTPEQFAGLLGVHQSSLYRWEAKGEEVVRLDPMQVRLLVVIREQLVQKRPEERVEWGKALLAALVIGGGLFALFKLLEVVFADSPTARASGSAKGGGSRAS